MSRFRSLVLCYHAVSATWPHGLSVEPDAFERQLRAVKARGFRPVAIEEAAAGRRRTVHVTFDDAYRSVRNALPALERLGFPATVFACTGFADRDGAPLAVPELADEADRHPAELATMGWDDLRELAERGVEIGSHTVGHAHLTQLDEEELHRELVDSKARLEDELARPCRWIAYPYGHDDARVHAAARAAGYDGAFSLRAAAGPFDAFAMPRVDVYRRDTRWRFALKAQPTLRRAALALRG